MNTDCARDQRMRQEAQVVAVLGFLVLMTVVSLVGLRHRRADNPTHFYRTVSYLTH